VKALALSIAVTLAAVAVPTAARVNASGHPDAPAAKTVCHTVTKRVHGKVVKKKICHTVKPTPTKTPIRTPTRAPTKTPKPKPTKTPAPLPTATPTVVPSPTFTSGSLGLTRVAGPSPLASCTAGGAGTNFPNTAIEPSVTVNPRNPLNIVGVWQQDRWSNGGAHGLVAGSSFDGGKTWNETSLPFTTCVAGGLSFQRASDPVVSFGPDGTVYAVGLAITDSGSNETSAIVTATSADGDKTWSNIRNLFEDDNSPTVLNDKEWITADPTKPGVAYVVWDRHDDANHTGPALFSKTTDSGLTWSKPVNIVSLTGNRQTLGNEIVVDPRNGTLYDVFASLQENDSPGPVLVQVVKSTDGGGGWTNPVTISNIQSSGANGGTRQTSIRSGPLPQAALDPTSGELYVIWADERLTSGGRRDGIVIATSDLLNQLHGRRTPDRIALVHSLSQVLLAGRAYDRAVVDGISTDLKDMQSYEFACRLGRIGFLPATSQNPGEPKYKNKHHVH